MYPHPISVSVGPYGSIFFLTEGENDGQKTSSLYTAQLHNPVKNITLVKKGILSAKEVNYCQSGSLVYLVGNDSPIQFVECEKGAVEVCLDKLRTHAELDDKLRALGLLSNGTIITKKAAIARHVTTLKDEYSRIGYSQAEVNFWNEDKAQGEQVVTHRYRFAAVHVLDHSLLYAASTSKLQLVSISITKDGYGTRGKAETVVKYNHDWVV